MSIFDTPDKQQRIINCDSCDKMVKFAMKDAATINDAHPWLKSLRVIQTNDARMFVYCSDPCEVKGVTSGVHNPVEKPRIISDGSEAAVNAAAAQAKATAEADAKLRAGEDVKIQVAQS